MIDRYVYIFEIRGMANPPVPSLCVGATKELCIEKAKREFHFFFEQEELWFDTKGELEKNLMINDEYRSKTDYFYICIKKYNL
jgi:hypothetical protein